MKFTIKRASAWLKAEKTREIKTLEELMAFVKEVKEDIIITKEGKIIIYDDYLE